MNLLKFRAQVVTKHSVIRIGLSLQDGNQFLSQLWRDSLASVADNRGVDIVSRKVSGFTAGHGSLSNLVLRFAVDPLSVSCQSPVGLMIVP